MDCSGYSHCPESSTTVVLDDILSLLGLDGAHALALEILVLLHTLYCPPWRLSIVFEWAFSHQDFIVRYFHMKFIMWKFYVGIFTWEFLRGPEEIKRIVNWIKSLWTKCIAYAKASHKARDVVLLHFLKLKSGLPIINGSCHIFSFHHMHQEARVKIVRERV